MIKPFADVLEDYVQQKNLSAGRLATLSGVPKQTIQSWRQGRVKRPRHIEPILQVAKALHLTIDQTNRLLFTSNHPSLATIRQTAESENNETVIALLPFWQEQEAQISETQSFSLKKQTEKPFQAPRRISDFVGRADEIEAISADLKTQGSVCILQGMGGIGKSTLANHLAYRLRDHFNDGVLWGTLSHGSVDDSDPHQHAMMILRDFATAYGVDVSEYSDAEQRSRIVLHLLASKRTLIILDDALGTDDIRYLLPTSNAHCSILITTRNKKMLSNRASTHNVTSFTDTDSLALLGQIIGTERVEDEKNEAAALIQFVGGLPLALRVIGSTIAEAGWLTLGEYRTLLQDEQARLTQLADWEDTSKNVRASFELSYSRLEPALQLLFDQLALFVAHDFSADAVAAIVEKPVPLVKINLGRLHTLSLLNFSTADTLSTVTNQQARYRLHPLLRAFAHEKLGQPDSSQKKRFVVYYVQFVEEYGFVQYEMLDQEWENIQIAIDWASDNGWDEQLYHLIEGLTQPHLGVLGYLDVRSYRSEGLDWLQRCLDTPFVQQNKLFTAFCHMKRGTFTISLEKQSAIQQLQQSYDLINNPTNEQEAICCAYTCQRLAKSMSGDNIEEILNWCQKAIDCLKPFNSPRVVHLRGWLFISQAAAWGQVGELDRAYEMTKKGIVSLPNHATFARMGAYSNLANIALIRGTFDEVESNRERMLADAQQLGHTQGIITSLINRGFGQFSQGNFIRSIELFEHAMEQIELISLPNMEGVLAYNFSRSLHELGKEERAQKVVDLIMMKRQELGIESIIYALVSRAELSIDFGKNLNASIDLDEAMALIQQYRHPILLGKILAAKARIALVNEQFENAKTLVRQALGANVHGGYQGIFFTIKGDILAGMRQYEKAMLAYDESLQLLEQGWRFEYMRTLTKVARLQWQWQQDIIVIEELKEILAVFEEMEAVHEMARVQTLIDEITNAS